MNADFFRIRNLLAFSSPGEDQLANLQTSPYESLDILGLPQPANTDKPVRTSLSEHKIISWLFRSKSRNKEAIPPLEGIEEIIEMPEELRDDWQLIESLCGYGAEVFAMAGSRLPLTGAEIDHFRRNHREMEVFIGRDFLTSKGDLPSPLSELYGLYRHRARLDTEAALFVAQATGSTRIARIMGDLLAIGSFANGHECVSYMTMTYSVPAAFDTSDLIDAANHEAARRLALSIEHPAHLLKLSPDEISLLATEIIEDNIMDSANFLEKANLLSEARQDVARLPVNKQFVTAISERDLPIHQMWVMRICAAYARIFESWVTGIPEIEAVVNRKPGMKRQ